jgi:hypothetical protein
LLHCNTCILLKQRRIVECDELLEEEADEGVSLSLSRSEKYQQQSEGHPSPSKTDSEFNRNDAIKWCTLVNKAAERRLTKQAGVDEVSKNLNFSNPFDRKSKNFFIQVMEAGLVTTTLTEISAAAGSNDAGRISKHIFLIYRNQFFLQLMVLGMSKSALDEVRSLYAAANELLRHFWCCFPATTPELEQKVSLV